MNSQRNSEAPKVLAAPELLGRRRHYAPSIRRVLCEQVSSLFARRATLCGYFDVERVPYSPPPCTGHAEYLTGNGYRTGPSGRSLNSAAKLSGVSFSLSAE